MVEHAVETFGTLADYQVHAIGCADEHDIGLFHHNEPFYTFVRYLSDAVVTVVHNDQLSFGRDKLSLHNLKLIVFYAHLVENLVILFVLISFVDYRLLY